MCPASRPMAPPNSVLASIPKWTSCSAIKPSMSLALDVPLRGLSSRAISKFLFDDEDLAMRHSLLFGSTVRLENQFCLVVHALTLSLLLQIESSSLWPHG